jgi:hypothetical protein
MNRAALLGLLLACGTAANGADDPASRLRGARSLRCTFTSNVETRISRGHRRIAQTSDKGAAVYDNINVTKGTARIVANSGAADIVAWRDRQDNLWMLERSPSGNEIVTTVFPMYAEGTDEFVVLETRHYQVIRAQVAVGDTAFGSCKILE